MLEELIKRVVSGFDNLLVVLALVFYLIITNRPKGNFFKDTNGSMLNHESRISKLETRVTHVEKDLEGVLEKEKQ
jgi:peptidoglycan hydrolase CwlO-like protein